MISLGQQHIRGSRTSISITVLVDFYGWWLVGQLALGGSLWFWQKCANGGKCARASVVREKSWVKVEFCLQQPEPSAACRPTYPLPEIGTGLQLAWLAPQAGSDPGLAGSPGPALAPRTGTRTGPARGRVPLCSVERQLPWKPKERAQPSESCLLARRSFAGLEEC